MLVDFDIESTVACVGYTVSILYGANLSVGF